MRSSFKKTAILPLCAILVLLAPMPASQAAPGDDADLQRGGKVKWARLKTASASWHRHARSDPDMLDYVRRNTTLNIDPLSYWADVGNLDQMCAYPLLFSEGTHWITDPAQQRNIGEYLRRGGFLLIDSCIAVNHDADAYFRSEAGFILSVLPEAEIRLIPNSDDIFHCFFDMQKGIPHTFYNNIFDPDWAAYGLHGIYYKGRLVAVISLSGLQCGWDRMVAPRGHYIECMKMLVNIYTYALTH
jgi:Domain of unknown function (DUF4159)